MVLPVVVIATTEEGLLVDDEGVADKHLMTELHCGAFDDADETVNPNASAHSYRK